MARKHRIAVIPGDGIGKEVVPESLKVLDEAARRFGFDLELTHYDWSCETFKETATYEPVAAVVPQANWDASAVDGGWDAAASQGWEAGAANWNN